MMNAVKHGRIAVPKGEGGKAKEKKNIKRYVRVHQLRAPERHKTSDDNECIIIVR